MQKKKFVELVIMLKKPCDINKELLIDILSNEGYDGFVDEENYIKTYIDEQTFDEDVLIKYSEYFNHYTTNIIEEQNWNKTWEENYFDPIIINKNCIIRAPFHEKKGHYDFEILIQPQMSFGTGHHETTRLIAQQLFELEYAHKKVLDMGTGTGILAIIAEKLGAKDLFAVDNDKWAYQNVQENLKLNHSTHIKPALGDASILPQEKSYDIILSNINLNINLENIPYYAQCAKKDSLLILSGFLDADIPVTDELCTKLGYQFVKKSKLGNWIMLKYKYTK